MLVNEYDFLVIVFFDMFSSDKLFNIVFVIGEIILLLMNSQDVIKGLVLVVLGYGMLWGSLYINLLVMVKLVSNEDFMFILFNVFGCGVDVIFYLIGQNLLEFKCDWLVSILGEKIIVIYGDQCIEVLSNGSYDIIQISSDMCSDEVLNVDLFSWVIKYLI